MQLEIAISDMHLLCNSIFCECHNKLPGLVVFTNFCQFCCWAMLQEAERQNRAILKPADLDNNLYFSSFQTGVPHYEDFISKAGKLHSHLKWVVQYQPWPILVAVTLMLSTSTTLCTTSKFMRAFYLKLSIFCSGSLPRIYEPFSLNIRVLVGVRVSYWSCSQMLWQYFIRPL